MKFHFKKKLTFDLADIIHNILIVQKGGLYKQIFT